MLKFRLMLWRESNAAADLHRASSALIPGYDPCRQSQDEFRELYRSLVLIDGPVWGAFEGPTLRGFVALLPGWIDHLYVDPARQGQGIGGALVRIAQREQHDLRLYAYQSNVRARRLYEAHGFRVEELTDGRRNDERIPDVTYQWRRRAARTGDRNHASRILPHPPAYDGSRGR